MKKWITSQKELTKKIQQTVEEINQTEQRMRDQQEVSQQFLIDTICLRNGIYRMKNHVYKIKNAKL